ncbi:MAG: hypothetical protein ACRDPE_00360 [Solirubrobacterales bacterium]
MAGPAPNPGGYTPCQYTAPVDGIYAVVMLPFSLSGGLSPTTVANPNTSTGQGPAIPIWDVTVRDAAGTVQPGRVFTDILELVVPTAVATVSDLSAFVSTPAAHVYHFTVFNPRSKVWDLAANSSGVVDATTRDPILASFRWGPTSGYPPTLVPTYGDAVAPQMWEGDAAVDGRDPIFFRTPDPVVFGGPGGLAETRDYSATPMVPEGGLSPALSFTGAGGEAGATVQGAGGTIGIDAPQLQAAGYAVTLDLDRDGGFGGGRDVEYGGTLRNGNAAASWDGRDSTGALVPCGVSYEFQATSALPAMHIVQADTSTEAGTEIERLSLPADPLLGSPLAASYDDLDPYKGTAITNAVPGSVSEGTSRPTFHGWSAQTGHAAFVDTWASGHAVDGTGTFEVRCPPASGTATADTPTSATPTGNAPATNPPGHEGRPKKHQHRRHPTHDKAPRLALSLTAGTALARPSSVIGYRITVSNPSPSAARDVKVCDEPPAGQRVLRTTPSAEGKGEPCWTVKVLAAGASRVFRLTVMVAPLSGPEVQRNDASARASNVKGARTDRVAVRIRPLPETACGSSLGRPLTSSIPYRC